MSLLFLPSYFWVLSGFSAGNSYNRCECPKRNRALCIGEDFSLKAIGYADEAFGCDSGFCGAGE